MRAISAGTPGHADSLLRRRRDAVVGCPIPLRGESRLGSPEWVKRRSGAPAKLGGVTTPARTWTNGRGLTGPTVRSGPRRTVHSPVRIAPQPAPTAPRPGPTPRPVGGPRPAPGSFDDITRPRAPRGAENVRSRTRGSPALVPDRICGYQCAGSGAECRAGQYCCRAPDRGPECADDCSAWCASITPTVCLPPGCGRDPSNPCSDCFPDPVRLELCESMNRPPRRPLLVPCPGAGASPVASRWYRR